MSALAGPRRTAQRHRLTFKVGGPVLALAGVLLIALIAQAVVASETDAFNWSAASAIVILFVLGYCLRPGLFQRFPLSTLALVGFNATTLAIPLIVQSATGHSLLANLRDPDDTFPWIYLTSLVLVGTHFAYTSISALHRPGQFVARHVFARFGLFRMPSNTEIWILGMIGFAATVVSWGTNQGAIEYGDVSGKVLQGFVLFVAFPLFIPFRGMFADRNVNMGSLSVPLLGLYFGAIVLLGMAANQRLLFSFATIGIGLATLMMSLMGRLRLSGRTKLAALALVAVAVPVFGTFEDLATAMTMVRGAKGSISGAEYLQLTLEQMGDKPAIQRYREYDEKDTAESINYNETYLSAQLLNRLVFTKYTDLTMDASTRFGSRERDLMRADVWSRLAAILPTPIASAFGLQVDKRLLEYSGGDLYQNFAYGTSLGSALTGSSITYSRDAFGSAWLPFVVLIFLLSFNSYDSLFLVAGQRRVLAPLAFIMLFTLFAHGYIDDNSVALILGATRGLLQQVGTYVVTMALIRTLLSFQRPAA